MVAEYVWIDAHNATRSKTKTLSKKPTCVDDLPVWNFDGSSTEQAAGDDSEIYLVPRAFFRDPFRGGDNVLVMAECFTPKMTPAIGNYRAKCADLMDKYLMFWRRRQGGFPFKLKPRRSLRCVSPRKFIRGSRNLAPRQLRSFRRAE